MCWDIDSSGANVCLKRSVTAVPEPTTAEYTAALAADPDLVVDNINFKCYADQDAKDKVTASGQVSAADGVNADYEIIQYTPAGGGSSTNGGDMISEDVEGFIIGMPPLHFGLITGGGVLFLLIVFCAARACMYPKSEDNKISVESSIRSDNI